MKFLLVVMLFLMGSFDYAHSRDRLILTPERELIRIEREGDFRIYIRNTFPSVLQDLRLTIANPAFEIEVVPAIMARLVPGERRFFLVKLKLREGFEEGDYSLRISVQVRTEDEVEPLIVKSQVVEVGEIVVRVERFIFTEGMHIYLIPIFLIVLLFWRRLRQK